MALWVRSSANFVWFAIKPAPKAVNDVWGFVVALALLLGVGVLGDAVSGWPVGFAFLGAVLVLLFVIAGVRLQRAKDAAGQVDLDFEEPFLLDEPLKTEGVGWQQLVVRVVNNGPAGRFRAVIASDVSGIPLQRYGRGTLLAWEGNADSELPLGAGDTGTLRIARSYPRIGMTVNGKAVVMSGQMRFVVPPSPDNPTTYGEGLPQVVEDATVEFDIAVRDVERDVLRRRRVRWVFNDSGRSSNANVQYVA